MTETNINNLSLVTVVVVAYHSAETISQTLDSIYNQTYPNIELIVCDDASTDDTAAVAQKWIDAHKDRFIGCTVHANPENLGVPGNLNTGIRMAKGKYIKDIAADDLLLPDCLEQNVTYCEKHGYENLFSRMYPFCIRNGQKVRCDDIDFDTAFFEKDAAGQYQDMLLYNRVFSPSFFASKAFLERLGLYDTRYRLLEDYPMFLKATKNGHTLNFMDAYTVEYRISDASISNTTNTRVTNPGYHRVMKDFFFRERLPELLKFRKFRRILNQLRGFFYMDLIVLFGNDRRIRAVQILEKLKNRTLFQK